MSTFNLFPDCRLGRSELANIIEGTNDFDPEEDAVIMKLQQQVCTGVHQGFH